VTVPTVLMHRSPELLAQAVAARLITRFVDVQSTGRVASWVLTGGRIADSIHRAVASSPARGAVDWGRVELWWGDERFVPRDSEDRNERQARHTLLDTLPLDPAHTHPMPSTDEVADIDEAAERYAATLAGHASPEDHGRIPTFDVLMLGVGPDGHVASLFPEQPALYDERPVVGVRGAPKPPPNRLTMTMPVLQRAREVWFVVSGADKARAVHLALAGAGVVQIPAAGPAGLNQTLWFLDRDAAAQLPPGLVRPASP
jgi:6-phosphogluconolactonase